MERACANCRFFVPADDPEEEPDAGECRRYPPTVMLNDPLATFPCTLDFYWCGEWAEKA